MRFTAYVRVPQTFMVKIYKALPMRLDLLNREANGLIITDPKGSVLYCRKMYSVYVRCDLR